MLRMASRATAVRVLQHVAELDLPYMSLSKTLDTFLWRQSLPPFGLR